MKPNLLFIHTTTAPDLMEDRHLLGARFDVASFHFEGNRPGRGLVRLGRILWLAMRQLLWLIRRLPRTALVYGCFADYHLALPALLAGWFRVPLVVRLGGFDGNTLPDVGYGVFLSRWRAPLARYVLRRADLLLPVTPSLIYNENRFAAWPDVHPNGVRAHVPGLQAPYAVVPTGYDPAAWPVGPAERGPVIVTVGYIGTERDVRVKGVDLLIEAARRLPEAAFRIVGVAEAMEPVLRQRYGAPDNVALERPVGREALAEAYTGAAVYAQLSRTEGGLPNVVAEAMLCGCIPVVSAVGSMPETVGEEGLVVERPDPDAIAAAIREALRAGPDARRRCRARIATQYTLGQRKERLLDALAPYLPAAETRP
jgi:glycosyltransferase involved in cell wall biosynthesis